MWNTFCSLDKRKAFNFALNNVLPSAFTYRWIQVSSRMVSGFCLHGRNMSETSTTSPARAISNVLCLNIPTILIIPARSRISHIEWCRNNHLYPLAKFSPRDNYEVAHNTNQNKILIGFMKWFSQENCVPKPKAPIRHLIFFWGS